MTSALFDTLKFVETLEASGFSKQQAKGVAAAIGLVQDSNLSDLATKGDILEVKRDLKETELRLTAEIAPLKWGVAVAVGGVVALLLKTFFPQ